MLRITVREHPLEERWILQGRLHKSSVPELLSTWKACRGRTCHRVVDLEGVTSIDRTGEEALMMMLGDGADLVAGGIYTRHLIEELKARNRNLPQH
jgi:ABC-type transporter Mla MlaB component